MTARLPVANAVLTEEKGQRQAAKTTLDFVRDAQTSRVSIPTHLSRPENEKTSKAGSSAQGRHTSKAAGGTVSHPYALPPAPPPTPLPFGGATPLAQSTPPTIAAPRRAQHDLHPGPTTPPRWSLSPPAFAQHSGRVLVPDTPAPVLSPRQSVGSPDVPHPIARLEKRKRGSKRQAQQDVRSQSPTPKKRRTRKGKSAPLVDSDLDNQPIADAPGLEAAGDPLGVLSPVSLSSPNRAVSLPTHAPAASEKDLIKDVFSEDDQYEEEEWNVEDIDMALRQAGAM